MPDYIPITNDGPHPRYVGGRMIPAGETRLIPMEDIPGYVAATSEPPSPEADPVEVILEHALPAIEEMLPALTEGELAELEAAERDGRNRKGLYERVGRERLARAERALAGTH